MFMEVVKEVKTESELKALLDFGLRGCKLLYQEYPSLNLGSFYMFNSQCEGCDKLFLRNLINLWVGVTVRKKSIEEKLISHI